MDFKFYTEVQKRIEFLRRSEAKLREQISKMEKGEIWVSKSGKYDRAYYTDENGKRSLKKNEQELKQTLAYKRFLRAQVFDSINEREVLEEFLQICDGRNQQLIKHFSKAETAEEASAVKQFLDNPLLNKLLKANYQTFNDKVAEWAYADYPHPIPTEQTHPLKDCFGRSVRSKTERDIANIYNKYGILFRYEEIYEVNGKTFCDDFSFWNPRTHKLNKHEHFGMWDDQIYVDRNLQKIGALASIKYVPDQNFIMTFETKEYPFDIYAFDEFVRDKIAVIGI